MGKETLIKPNRAAFVETADTDKVMFIIDAAAARVAGSVPVGTARLIDDLVMGVPVTRTELDRAGITALQLYEFEEADISQFQQVRH